MKVEYHIKFPTFYNISTHIMIMLLGSNMQSVVMVSSSSSHISAMLQQQDGNVDVAETRRDVEGRLSLASFCFYCRTVAEQYAYYVGLLMNKSINFEVLVCSRP